MTLFNKVVEEAVVEVIKPAAVTYHAEFTPEEMATLILAVGSTAGIGTDLYRKLRNGVGMSDLDRLPTLNKSVLGHPVVSRIAIVATVAMMK